MSESAIDLAQKSFDQLNRKDRRLRALCGLALPAAIFIAWELAARRGDTPDYLVPPTAILMSFWKLLISGPLLADAAASSTRAFIGFFLGASAGVTAGLMSGVSARVNSFFDPLVSLLYPVPKVALLPVLMTWLGFGDASKIALISLAVFFPTFINSLYGARGVSIRLIWAATNMGASPSRIFWMVIFPGSLPSVFNGLRIGLALSFIVLFATEMVGSKNGLGNMIIAAEESLRYDWMFAGIFAIALIGFTSDRILMAVRRMLLARKFSGEGRDE